MNATCQSVGHHAYILSMIRSELVVNSFGLSRRVTVDHVLQLRAPCIDLRDIDVRSATMHACMRRVNMLAAAAILCLAHPALRTPAPTWYAWCTFAGARFVSPYINQHLELPSALTISSCRLLVEISLSSSGCSSMLPVTCRSVKITPEI